MWQWMKHGSITMRTLQNQIGSQLSEQQRVKTVRSDQKRKYQLVKVLASVLVRLKKEIAKKRPQMKKKKVLFHQDNAPYHKSIATIAKFHELHFELLPHQPYSLDLVPSD